MGTYIRNGCIEGKFQVPASKSLSLRYLLLASVASGESCISNIILCDDVMAMLQNFDVLGIKYSLQKSSTYSANIQIVGRKWRGGETLNCGESGFLARTLPIINAIQRNSSTINGTGSLCRRSLADLCEVIEASGGESPSSVFLPLIVNAYEPKREIRLERLDSSQSLSGLLIALPLARRATTLYYAPPASHGYLALTLDSIRRFEGVYRTNPSVPNQLVFSPQGYRGQDLAVEGDWSSAAQLIALLKPGEQMTLSGVSRSSLQHDSAILSVLERIGMRSEWDNCLLQLVWDRTAKPFVFNAYNTPDLIPALAVLATHCSEPSTIFGIERLYNKESNRALALYELLTQFGHRCLLTEDSLCVSAGNPKAPKEPLRTYHDHRIAMAAVALALHSAEGATLDDTECISKSFPNFLEVIRSNIR